MNALETLKKTISTIAPALATAFGGPAAGIAVGTLSNLLLGKPNGSESEILNALSTISPEMLLKIKQLDLEYAKSEFQAVQDVYLREIELTKTTGKRDWVRGFIVIAIFVLIAGIIGFNMHIPDTTEKDTLNHLLLIMASITGFYFGTKK
jgi:hypothetical protein